MKKKWRGLALSLGMILLLGFIIPNAVFANETSEQKYYLGTESLVNTGNDNGYSGEDQIKEGDPHFGWKIGSFYVDGYTRVADTDSENPVFLKNVGDKVALWFTLEQDIDCLNGKENLTISEDANGYDQYFGIEKTNFGRGTLIIRHTDYQNHTGDPTIYTDYLKANISNGANTKVEMFEEGDYEVSLLYEIKDDPRNVFGVSILPSYTNYRMSFQFSVRNGNCMVFPFDTETGEELTNTAVTENGFYLDLAKSRYLDINIKKEVLNEGADGLVEDVRFNRPAKDGDTYTEEGVYTITVSNRYTGEETEKLIYVGTNNILKAHAATGLSLNEIERQLADGAKIAENGEIIPVGNTGQESSQSEESGSQSAQEEAGPADTWDSMSLIVLITVGIAAVMIMIVLVIVIHRYRKKKAQKVSQIEKGE